MGSVLAITVSVPASAAPSRISLGAAESFAVLAGGAITVNTTTNVTGDLGTKIGSAANTITGAHLVQPGGANIASEDATTTAKNDLLKAYEQVGALKVFTSLASAELGGKTRTPGVYKTDTAFGLTGVLTLDGKDDPNAVFIFQTAAALTTAAASCIQLINGAQACNVFWRLGAAATFGASSTFVGVVMANEAITAGDGAKFSGPLFSNTAAITLSNNTIVNDGCEPVEEVPPVVQPNPPVVDPIPPAPVTDSPTGDEGDPQADAEPEAITGSTNSPQPRSEPSSALNTGTESTNSPQPRSETSSPSSTSTESDTNSAPSTGTGSTNSPDPGLESNSEALPVSVTVPGGVIPNTDANKQLLPLGLGLSLSVGAASFLLRLRHVV